MLLYENFMLLLQINNGLRQASFSFARRYVHNGELTARLQNQLWFISVCLRRGVFPPTVKNLHLPACISRASQRGVRLHILRKMKRGLRTSLEAAKRKLRQLNTNLGSFPPGDTEELRSGRAQAFSTTYARASKHYRGRLHWLCAQEGRPLNQPEAQADRSLVPADRVTDKTNELTHVEKELLSRGPKFALTAAVNEETREACRTSFARFAYQFRWGITRESDGERAGPGGEANLPTFPRSWDVNLPPTNPDTEGKLRRLYHAVMTIVESQPPRARWSNLPREETRALRALRNKPVALMPSDKGGEFCAVSSETYRELGRSHLADTTTYRPVPRMTAKTVEGKINCAWKAVCRERAIPWRCERSFISSSTRLATFHHVIKTHKPGPELRIRPIVASRGSPTEKIAWLLKSILSPLLNNVPTHLPDSEHLMTAVLNTETSVRTQHQHQCSLDVEALYTSTPVDEALNAVRAKLLSGAAAIPEPLRTEDVIELLGTAFSLTYFHFEGQVYRQVRGLPMGCAVSGIVAILFMEAIERRALTQFARCPLYLRYVDDCYALVKDANEAQELQACLNSQHPSINFELENCRRDRDTTSLSLLDLTVNISADGEATFDFFRKEARSEVFMHRDSALPWSQKAATIRNEQRRIATRSSGNEETNQAAFTRRLRANGYTTEDLRRINPAIRRPRPNRTRPGGTVHYIDLPFLGESAERRIRRAFTQEGINVRIYRRSTTILDVVRPRQPEIRRCPWTTCPTKERANCFARNVVYEITCSPCGHRYVGSTTRPLHERVREHTVTGRGSAIHEHLLTCGEGAARVQVRILAKEKDEVNTRLREAIAIKRLRPELNTRADSDLVDLVF